MRIPTSIALTAALGFGCGASSSSVSPDGAVDATSEAGEAGGAPSDGGLAPDAPTSGSDASPTGADATTSNLVLALATPALAKGVTLATVTLSVTNAGPTSVTVPAAALGLPAGLEHVAGGTYDSTTGAVSVTSVSGMLAPGATAKGTVTFLMPNLGAVPVTATVSGAHASASVPALVYDAPLVITKGGTYTGNWRSDDPTVDAVQIATSEAVTIDGANIVAAGGAIDVPSQAVALIVRNVNAAALYTNRAGQAKGMFVNCGNFASLLVAHTHSVGFSEGLRVLDFGTAPPSGQKVTVLYNEFRNIDARTSDGDGGYDTTLSSAGTNAVGLNSLKGAVVEIGWNEVINLPGESWAGDLISTYESSGTDASPIEIHDNFVQGDYPPVPTAAVPFSGCGIQIGDAPNRDDVGFTQAHDNQVISIDNCGIGISSGHDQRVFANRVVSAATTPEGVALGGQYRSAYGEWDYYAHSDPSTPLPADPTWHDNSVHDNVENVVTASGQRASDMLVDTDSNTKNNTVIGSAPATIADLQAEIATWRAKRAMSPEPLGPLR